MKSVFSPAQEKAIEYLAQGGFTMKEIAEACQVTTVTLLTWRKNEEFQDKVRQRCRELLKEQEPRLYNLALGQAEKSGSFQHIKLLLERIERLEDIAEGRNTEDNTLIVKWGGKE